MAPPIIGAVPEEAAVPVTIRSASTANALAPHQERQNSEVDIYAPADRYYGAQNDTHKPRRTATFSTVRSNSFEEAVALANFGRTTRQVHYARDQWHCLKHVVPVLVGFYRSILEESLLILLPADEHSMQPKKFLINVDPTLAELLKAEDSDGNFQITIEDTGNKACILHILYL